MPSATRTMPEHVLASTATDALGDFAITAVWMAVIWLASLGITIAGVGTGALVVYGVRDLAKICYRQFRRSQPEPEYAQLVTVYSDGITSKIINLDQYRRRSHEQHRSNTTESTDDPESGSDGPA